MGKKSNVNREAGAAASLSISIPSGIGVVEKTRVKKNKKSKKNIVGNSEIEIGQGECITKSKKIKSNKMHPLDTTEQNSVEGPETLKNSKKHKNDNGQVELPNIPMKKSKSNKSSSVDAHQQERVQPSDSLKKPKKKQEKSQEEEDQIDEKEIDAFCEGLDEEDNTQFEDWVKLVEAKLFSKSRTPRAEKNKVERSDTNAGTDETATSGASAPKKKKKRKIANETPM